MEITEYLPVDFRTQMEAETLCGAEEIRLRVGQPLEILYADEKEKEIGLLTEAHMRERNEIRSIGEILRYNPRRNGKKRRKEYYFMSIC